MAGGTELGAGPSVVVGRASWAVQQLPVQEVPTCLVGLPQAGAVKGAKPAATEQEGEGARLPVRALQDEGVSTAVRAPSSCSPMIFQSHTMTSPHSKKKMGP